VIATVLRRQFSLKESSITNPLVGYLIENENPLSFSDSSSTDRRRARRLTVVSVALVGCE
jgi:hypothetical protein